MVRGAAASPQQQQQQHHHASRCKNIRIIGKNIRIGLFSNVLSYKYDKIKNG
jgi:hypothetical protein